LVAVHGTKSTWNFVAHATKNFADENSCKVEFAIKKKKLVSNNYDNGTVEMGDAYTRKLVSHLD